MNVWSQIVEAYIKPQKSVEPAQKKVGRKPVAYVTEKKCTICGEVKPRSEFYSRHDRSPDALTSRCKRCYIRNTNHRYDKYKI